MRSPRYIDFVRCAKRICDVCRRFAHRCVARNSLLLASRSHEGLDIVTLTTTKDENVFKFGGIEAKLQQKQRLPEWIGGVALGAGLVLVLVGLRKR
jgi:hypothetical protein